MAYIDAICISHKKGIVKKEIREATFIEDFGIEGDAHAGKWHRQVSLLAGESIDAMKKKIPSLSKGAFAENLIIRGLDWQEIQVGDRLQLGDGVILEITQIGKECHTSCQIKKLTGDCIMPREGLFARVIRSGEIKVKDSVQFLSERHQTGMARVS